MPDGYGVGYDVSCLSLSDSVVQTDFKSGPPTISFELEVYVS